MTSLVLAALLYATPAPQANVFTLETHWRAEDGSDRAFSTLKGRPFVLAFIYTSCPGTCPLTTAKLKRLDAALKAQKTPLPMVVVSLDPEHDTPQAVHHYRERYALEHAEHWSVFVGAEAALRTLTQLLDFKYAQNPESKQIMHDNTVYLISRGGEVLTALSSLDDSSAPLLEQAAQSEGKQR
ncbi:MAG: SCO family protein [Myxococcaceae bacterium]|nr:SCO family protein [Myxococcaceae bacterium]